LPLCDGWVIERPIAATSLFDAMGCYPLFACSDWSRLGEDCESLRYRCVSLALVTDPFAPLTEPDLRRWFDVVVRFKDHFVVGVGPGHGPAASKHHRYYARKGLRETAVTRCDPSGPQALDNWSTLYANLVRRHGLRGIKAFSRQAFATQLQVPGLVMIQARRGEEIVGAHLWLVQGNVAYSHLMAMSDSGYQSNAAYALYWSAIERAAEFFGPHVTTLNLGAGAGLGGGVDDGLTLFKRGWARGTMPTYLCGKVLDPERYAALNAARGTPAMSYFPAYRHGEFT
jgi:hypothetical protein